MPELSTGDVLAGYRVEAVAGRGGMGVVYRATQLALERQVALKLIAPELAQDEAFRERFKRESKTAALIEHAHVIPVHEAGEADGQLFIAMRFVEGTDLRELIRQEGRIAPARATRLLTQVASALDAAHARGLVHRDIKPGNVLIAHEDGQDHAYLSDFGLSKRVGSESGVTRSGMWVGTLDYIAPEQIQGFELDARSDVYSLGCLLYHTVTGRIPFERDSDVAKIFAHMSETPPSLREVDERLPADLDAVLLRAMAKEPGHRYPSAGDLGRAARAAVEGIPVIQAERSVATGAAAPSAHRGTVAAEAPRVRRRRVSPIAGALLALAVAAAVLAVAGVFSGGDEGSADEEFAFGEGSVTVTPIRVDSPGGVAIGTGGLWVTSYERNRVSRIDTESGAVAESVPVGDGPAALTVGDGAVWVVNDDAGTVSKVDIERGEVVGNPIALPSTNYGDSIATGDGRVWVVLPDQGRIAAIDVSSGRTGRRIAPPDGTAGELAFGEGGLWVVGDTGTVTRVDPASGESGEPVKVGKRPPPDSDVFRGEIGVGEGAVWIAALDDETVVRVDPRSGRVVKTIKFRDGIEGDLAVGGGAVWVVDESGRLLRIDPRKNAVAGRPLPSGTAGAYDITVGEGAVWIAGDPAQDTLTRVAP
jgi:streptogramin lyase/predicted Ser/Thr protein kinase